LAVVVANALDLARDSVRKAKLDPDAVTVRVDVPESLVVEVATHQIAMALMNVLKNAFEAFVIGGTLHEGRIEIATALAGDHVNVVVRDDGQGMSEEEAPRAAAVHPRSPQQIEEAQHGIRPTDRGSQLRRARWLTGTGEPRR
jgi:signal transduction histidine kinase